MNISQEELVSIVTKIVMIIQKFQVSKLIH